MKITTDAELFNCIHELYGGSHMSQYDLSVALQITPRGVSFLTQEAGYHRHKLKNPNKPVKFEEFIKEPYAGYIIKKLGLLHEECY